jgi:hypothetical protein
MVAVAMAALPMGVGVIGYRLNERADDFSRRAEFHAAQSFKFGGIEFEALGRIHELAQKLGPAMARGPDSSGELSSLQSESVELSREASSATLRAEYHRRMARKYEFASRHPWFAVEPDPPEPE